MKVDHIFIFSNKGKETDELIEFGLTEGSGRMHKGIGTANRRIFFDNFYLEIIWVENEQEAKSVSNFGIWERSNYNNNQYSRFGLCLTNTKETDSIFYDSIKWEPDFLPQGEFINILTNESMPWIFRISANRDNKIGEPNTHKNGIRKLTMLTFHLQQIDFKRNISKIERKSCVKFEKSSKNYITLEFDHGKQGKIKQFNSLGLVIKY